MPGPGHPSATALAHTRRRTRKWLHRLESCKCFSATLHNHTCVNGPPRGTRKAPEETKKGGGGEGRLPDRAAVSSGQRSRNPPQGRTPPSPHHLWVIGAGRLAGARPWEMQRNCAIVRRRSEPLSSRGRFFAMPCSQKWSLRQLPGDPNGGT